MQFEPCGWNCQLGRFRLNEMQSCSKVSKLNQIGIASLQKFNPDVHSEIQNLESLHRPMNLIGQRLRFEI